MLHEVVAVHLQSQEVILQTHPTRNTVDCSDENQFQFSCTALGINPCIRLCL